MGFGMPAPQNLFLPLRLPRVFCGVRRESGRGFHGACDFVKVVTPALFFLYWGRSSDKIPVYLRSSPVKLELPYAIKWSSRKNKKNELHLLGERTIK
jgi:hypothetical protein